VVNGFIFDDFLEMSKLANLDDIACGTGDGESLEVNLAGAFRNGSPEDDLQRIQFAAEMQHALSCGHHRLFTRLVTSCRSSLIFSSNPCETLTAFMPFSFATAIV
jgi:hypothetical protein